MSGTPRPDVVPSSAESSYTDTLEEAPPSECAPTPQPLAARGDLGQARGDPGLVSGDSNLVPLLLPAEQMQALMSVLAQTSSVLGRQNNQYEWLFAKNEKHNQDVKRALDQALAKCANLEKENERLCATLDEVMARLPPPTMPASGRGWISPPALASQRDAPAHDAPAPQGWISSPAPREEPAPSVRLAPRVHLRPVPPPLSIAGPSLR